MGMGVGGGVGERSGREALCKDVVKVHCGRCRLETIHGGGFSCQVST